MTPMSLYGDSNVKFRMTNPMAAFCMAVSREMAMIWGRDCLEFSLRRLRWASYLARAARVAPRM